MGIEWIGKIENGKQSNWENPVVHDLEKALTPLRLVPTIKSKYMDHIKRHMWGLNPWSKSLSSAPYWMFVDILNKVDEEYQKLIDQEWNPGPKVFVVRSKEPAWTNAIFPKENLSEDSIFVSHRDIWNEKINGWGGQKILCSLIWDENMPTTNLIHVIMWPYGDSWKAGIYTMVFWDKWMPFPKKLDEKATKEQRENNAKFEEYWDSHVMLITLDEIENIIKHKKERWMPTDAEERALEKFKLKNWKSPIQKDFVPEPADWAIELTI